MAIRGRPYILGIDIGGTFTDVIALHTETGQVRSAKSPTTPARFVEGILNSVKSLGISLGEIGQIIHGSTICTNALIEHKQARTGFIGTKGFSDEFDIQRMVRRWSKTPWSAIYDLHQVKPPPFVPRYLRKEVDERVIYPGRVLKALDPEEARARALELQRAGVAVIAVCFLWSPVYAEHEKRVKQIIQEADRKSVV